MWVELALVIVWLEDFGMMEAFYGNVSHGSDWTKLTGVGNV